jgi:hypothetical protein
LRRRIFDWSFTKAYVALGTFSKRRQLGLTQRFGGRHFAAEQVAIKLRHHGTGLQIVDLP